MVLDLLFFRGVNSRFHGPIVLKGGNYCDILIYACSKRNQEIYPLRMTEEK